MMTVQLAERCAEIAWSSIQTLMSSEVAAQHAIAGTPLDFEFYAKQFLVRAFMLGRPEKIATRIDATAGERHEDQTGDYHFAQPENLLTMTYAQANMALVGKVPEELRRKFKQLHSRGANPYEAYTQIINEWEAVREQMAEVLQGHLE